MAHLQWSSDLNTNISIIDDQHKRIVYFINALEDVNESGDISNLGKILKDLSDYTISHLDFEESLLDKVGYASIKPHQRVHQLFRDRIAKYIDRYSKEDGAAIARELHKMLSRWLFDHIRTEDFRYVAAVGPDMIAVVKNESAWVSSSVNRFFR